MEFIKFPHIKNVEHALQTIQRTLLQHPDGANSQWVATEKLDGSNFQFSVTADHIVCYSRNFVLGEERVFHNFQQLEAKYRGRLRAVYELLSERAGSRDLVVRVYGEIFGGQYPGVKWDEYVASRGVQGDEAKVDGAAAGALSLNKTDNDKLKSLPECVHIRPVNGVPVQERVFYLPDVDFYLFDISSARSDLGPDHPDGGPVHLDIEDLLEVASRCGFPYASRVLHRGTFAELQQLDPDFATSIPALVGLPPLEGNTAEGYVLLPLHQPRPKAPLRLKLKSQKFCEVEKLARSGDGPQKQTPKKDYVPTGPPRGLRTPLAVLTPREQELEAHLAACVNTNRLYSVKSKLEAGQLGRMDPRRLASLLLDDALEEIVEDREDLEELLADLDKGSMKKVKGNVFYEAYRVVEEARSSADH